MIEPTKEMIEAGAQRLVSWEDGSVWPNSWDGLAVAAARQEAERVWRSMWMAMPMPERRLFIQLTREETGALPLYIRKSDITLVRPVALGDSTVVYFGGTTEYVTENHIDIIAELER